MCGIAGILRADGERIPDPWLDALDGRVAYRGPDGTGRFRDRVEFRGEDGSEQVMDVALVHRRLSIIDLEGGGQPMVSPRGRSDDEGLVAVVFNGCIYNHRDLRRHLEASGHRFATDHSDTEALIHAYREWGPDLTDHLEGMYALALWDRQRQSLVLARDWFGEKPLYLRRGLGGNRQVLSFASDARALADMGGACLPASDDEALARWTETYLQLGYSYGTSTPYENAEGDGVVSVPPTIVERIEELMPRRATETRSQADFEQLIDQAVARRLEADVPLGCFLSGGVDSSLLAHFARRHKPDLQTFCVRMPDPRYDESSFAETAAEHLRTRHTTLDVAASPAEDLVHLVQTLGQPFGDSSVLPTYWVSRAARDHVKVALSGDGGDELFIGYDRYMAARHLMRHRRVLQWLPRSLQQQSHPRSWKHRLGRLGEMARDVPALGILAMESLFTCRQIEQLLGRRPQRLAEQLPGFDPMQSLRRADLIGYLPGDLLTKVDTASMAVGLEVRAPYLDRDLARAALAAPTYQLAPDGKRKGLLRQIARNHLPQSIADRRKMGFAIPLGQWFRNDFGSMRALLLDHLRSADPFGPVELQRSAVKRLIDEHLAGRHDHAQRLFALLTLSIWAKSL